MQYNVEKKEIVVNRKLNTLDIFALDFIRVIEKHTDYVIISGYISILLGRARATEDIDMFVKNLSKKSFALLYNDLKNNAFWCLNAENPDEVYSYLAEGLAVRFAREGNAIPNFEVKYPKNTMDKETFDDTIRVILPEGVIKISSLERQIAFKRYYLKSPKDREDALHIEELFGDKLDKEKINKLKEKIKYYD